MKSKLKIIVLAVCAFFLTNAAFFAQNNSESENSQQSQAQNGQNDSEMPPEESERNPAEDDDEEYDDDDAPDVYDDGDEEFVYLQNAAGDQFINIRLMPNIPLNFGNKLKVGGQVTVGYSRFLTSWLALGVELAFGYNPTIGNNILTYIPMTVGVTFLPAIKKFEFPITANVGMVATNYLSNSYFPGLVVRGGAGCYYRITESWSAGLECFFTYMPQWYFKQPEKNDYLNMISVSAGVKYHF